MSYFGLIPDDAHGKEHLTIVWSAKVFDEVWQDMEELADRMTHMLCPIIGNVVRTELFSAVSVYRIDVPHRLHVYRHTTFAKYDQTRRGLDWKPHMTIIPGAPIRRRADQVKFDRIEWRH